MFYLFSLEKIKAKYIHINVYVYYIVSWVDRW